jgi:hypothetical protein
MFGLGPGYMFVLQHRAPIGLMAERRAWLSVIGNNLGLTLLVLAEILLAGPVAFVAVHLSIVMLAASIGVWLFYVQHQFEGAYWARNAPPTCICRRCCAGSPPTSARTTSTTPAARSPSIACPRC